MKIIIREGSAAKNFEALIELLNDYPENIMFCSDDKHPDSLVSGHINQLCARAVAKGISVFNVLRAACINPVKHYNLPVGQLREGDAADLIVVKDLRKFEVTQTYINGLLVAENGMSLLKSKTQMDGNSAEQPVASHPKSVNNFSCDKKKPADFAYRAEYWRKQNESMITPSLPLSVNSSLSIPVIEALDGQLITNRMETDVEEEDLFLSADASRDILKIVVINRYGNAPVAKAFIKNFGLKTGAIASSVAHDSHNIVAVGVDDESLCKAVNLVIHEKGGISCVSADAERVLALPVAGLMSNENGYKVAEAYTAIDAMAKSLGSTLSAPFMTLSFMALLVIPHLKLSDKGLFDADAFKIIHKA